MLDITLVLLDCMTHNACDEIKISESLVQDVRQKQ